LIIGKKLFFGCLALAFLSTTAVSENRFKVINDEYLTVIFEDGLKSSAMDVKNLFPHVRNEIESLLGLTLKSRPTVILIKTRKRFLQMADHPITVAFAVPDRNLIVMDYSKVITHPFSLETTFMHEFCHLVLHHYIPAIPRWLDEGICQWASGGIDEIIYDRNPNALDLAAVTGKYLPFNHLNQRFPGASDQRVLAYQQSKRFVTFIVEKKGKQKFFEFLKKLQQGHDIDTAFYDVFKLTIQEFEKAWHQTLARRLTWMAWLSRHLYEFLFFCAALICVAGFVKLVLRKRNYTDEDMDEIEK
jgi:hypothetical protein